MTARKKSGAPAPQIRPPGWKPEPLDPEARGREFEVKTDEVAEVMRRALGLGADVDLNGYIRRCARRYAMTAMSGEVANPWPPSRPTEQALKRELLRVEKAARAVLTGRDVRAAGNLLVAIKALSRDGQRALPEALFLLADMPAPAVPDLERVARNAAAAAAVIPDGQKHPGGGRPRGIDADAQAVLLAQDFAALTGRPAAVNRRVDPPLGSYELLVCEVFGAIGMKGDPRKAAERAVRRLRKPPSAKLAEQE